MKLTNIVIAVALLCLTSGCTTMTPTERAKRDYENAVAREARFGYKWTQVWSEEYRKLTLQEYDITAALWDLQAKQAKEPLSNKESAEIDSLSRARADIRARKAVLKEKMAPALALQSADSYARYKADYAFQESLMEKDRKDQKRPGGTGAMFPDAQADGNR
jgi:hypothetical protein